MLILLSVMLSQEISADSTARRVPVERMADVSGTAQLVALWLHDKTPQSRRNYEADVRGFIGFLVQENPKNVRLNDLDLRTVTLNDLQAYADYLEVKGLASATRRRRLASMRSLLRFGHSIDYLRYNVSVKVKLPKRKDTLAERILTERQAITMMAAPLPERDRLIVEFFYYTGARVGEMAILRWRDISPNRDGHGQVTLFGKGEETRRVVIPKQLYEALLATRVDNNPDSAVFPSRKGKKPLQVRQIRDIVAKAGELAQVQGRVSPHWLRHSHASHAMDRGAPTQLVQHTLGHKSLDTTSRYAHAKPNDSSGLYLAR